MSSVEEKYTIFEKVEDKVTPWVNWMSFQKRKVIETAGIEPGTSGSQRFGNISRNVNRESHAKNLFSALCFSYKLITFIKCY